MGSDVLLGVGGGSNTKNIQKQQSKLDGQHSTSFTTVVPVLPNLTATISRRKFSYMVLCGNGVG